MTLCYKKTTTNVIHIKQQQQLNNSHTKVVVEYVYLFVYSMILWLKFHWNLATLKCYILLSLKEIAEITDCVCFQWMFYDLLSLNWWTTSSTWCVLMLYF